MDNSDDSKKSFFKYVFKLDDEGKSEIMNLLQYSFIILIPIIILSKLLEKYSPPKDDTKGSLEISAEIIIQIIILMIGLYFINRIATFFPTFSGENYPKMDLIISAISVLIILPYNITEKVNVLTERIYDLWEGKTDKNSKTKTVTVNGKQVTVKVNQPTNQQQQQQQPSMSSTSQAVYNDGTAINQLPTNDMSRAQQYSLSSQSLPNYDAMYRQDSTPLVGAATPGGGTESFVQEPMAANDALGSWGGFSSW
jgi:hypothetical protein